MFERFYLQVRSRLFCSRKLNFRWIEKSYGFLMKLKWDSFMFDNSRIEAFHEDEKKGDFTFAEGFNFTTVVS